jgi:hypothetical protein
MVDDSDHVRIFEGAECGGGTDRAGRAEPCNGGHLRRIAPGLFQCDGPGHHQKTATMWQGRPALFDVLGAWFTADDPGTSGCYAVRLPDGAEGRAWWDQERRGWYCVEENEERGYSAASETCEITGWRPLPP